MEAIIKTLKLLNLLRLSKVSKISLIIFIALLSCLTNAFSKSYLKYNISKYNNFLVISFKNDKNWHTYWKNPGDAGETFQFNFQQNEKQIKFKELAWPVPSTLHKQGNLTAYAYTGIYSFFFKLPSKDLSNFSYNKDIKIKIKYLICDKLCIPGQIVTSIKLQKKDLKKIKKDQFLISQKDLEKNFQKIPLVLTDVPSDIDIILKNINSKSLALFVSTSNNFKRLNKKNFIYLYPNDLLDFKAEQYISKDNQNYTKYIIDWDGEYNEPPISLPQDLIFKVPLELKFLIYSKKINNFVIIKKDIRTLSTLKFKSLNLLFDNIHSETKKKTSENKSNKKPLLIILLFAFLGGLILNIMPCVLPVITLKLYSLIKSKNKKQIFKHNMFYSLGIILTMLSLAIIVHTLKIAGNMVGWGFQLQSPIFVFVMTSILLIFSFNLFGLFNFSTPAGSKLGSVKLKQNIWGDIASGMIATVLSTPCSAPFLGTAISFAFSESIFKLYLIFLFLALGLSSPFLLIAFFPRLISFLPSAGEWMNTLKKFLGLSMIITSIWLWDIFLILTTYDLFIYSAIFFSSLYFILLMQKRAKKASKLLSIIFLCFSLSLLVYKFSQWKKSPISNSTLSSKKKESKWIAWDKQTMLKLKKNKRKVFIDFTAKWCLTCKINKKLVLESDKFNNYIKKNNIVLMLGDWTKKDPKISKFLNSYKLYGVPAYFIIKDNKIINLHESITYEKIIQAFEK